MAPSRSSSYVHVPVEPHEYRALRQQAAESAKRLDEYREKYKQHRMRTLEQMDADFNIKIADLAEQHAQAEDQIELAQQAGLRRLKRDEAAVMAARDGSSYEQKLERIERLRRAFEHDFHPSDEYSAHVEQNSSGTLMSALMGAMGAMGAPGGGMTRVLLGGGPVTAGVTAPMRLTTTASSMAQRPPRDDPRFRGGNADGGGVGSVRIEEVVDSGDERDDDDGRRHRRSSGDID